MKNSLNHVWSIICSNSLLDKDTNNLSFFNAIEKFTFKIQESELEKIKKDNKEDIIFQIPFQVVSRFARQDTGKVETLDYKVMLISPEGKIISTSNQKLAIEKNIKNFRVRTNFQSLPVSKSGDYLIAIEFKDLIENRFNRVAELPIEVVLEIIPDKK
ncbi:MAG: hypothetical protein PHT16_01360 [Candidatus Pacebacteria bacterium]|nr:hypothetical protein [Candidatus Paceibacterota bacterium]